jgi:hypothetical protein
MTDHEIALFSLYAAIIAMIISVVALVYTVKTFWLKLGTNIRGSFTQCSSTTCQGTYISNITLENLKDKAVVIFKIYLKIGHNIFLEIANFDDSPLILEPFKVFRQEYEPIDFYCVNRSRINIDSLLSHKKSLVLVTTDGRYVIRNLIKDWDPVYEFFKNHLTTIIRPFRSTYKGKAYGGNAKYLVEFKMESGEQQVIPIYPLDYEIKRFKHFQLTRASLESRASLQEFLYERVVEGTLKCVDLDVHDINKWREDVYDQFDKHVVNANFTGWFGYHVVGRLYTIIHDYRLKMQNKRRRVQRNNDKSDSN